MESLGGENEPMVRAHVAGELHQAESDISALQKAGKQVPSTLHHRRAILQEGHEQAQAGIPATGMEASVARIRETAMMPIKAQRAITRRGGDMQAPVAGEFYPGRHDIGKAIGDLSFGKDTEKSYRMQIASPVLSARTSPQIEVRAAAGMAAVMRGAPEIGVTLGHQAARYLSEGMRGSQNRPPVEAGKYSLEDLAKHRPDAAALVLQHGAVSQGLVDSKLDIEEASASKQEQMQALGGRSGSRLHLPPGLEMPTAAFVSGLGNVGWPKGGRAIERFHTDPSEFGDFAQHKIPSYTWNISQAGQLAEGTHHFLGALTHGDKWFAAHPEAEEHIRKASAHPAWHDPTSTIDVWSGRIASGLPYHVSRALDENTNPENIMKFAGVKGLSGVKRESGRAIGKASDLGYLYGEEAHRQAGAAMSVKLPGGGRVAMPGHIAQSLSWFGGQSQEYAADIKSGAKTLTPTSAEDPRGLNPLQFPKMWKG
jgi:hypothetical protein